MDKPQPTKQLQRAWARQRIWSQTANRLKQRIERVRLSALLFAIATGVLAVAGEQIGGLSSPIGRSLSAGAAITGGLATFLQRRITTETIRDWTRARSASEGLKTEIHSYLGGGTAYAGPDRDQHLAATTHSIMGTVTGLDRHTLGITPDRKTLPKIHDVTTYIEVRVNDQIHNYYRRMAGIYQLRVNRLRTVGNLLGAVTVVLAALGTAFQLAGLAAWVPVVTTVGASLTAHVAAARYDHLVIEFLRTAQRLEDLRDKYVDDPTQGAGPFIDASEAAISIENQGWMARWNEPPTHIE
jgi:hypothetical protein